jgi:hypothetical protein
MAGKAKKKPAKMANRNVGQEVVKDDGEKYAVVDPSGICLYPGKGVALGEAVRLATSLVTPAGVAHVNPDGSLTQGRLDESGAFVAVGS